MHKLLRTVSVILAISCIICLSACGEETNNKKRDQKPENTEKASEQALVTPGRSDAVSTAAPDSDDGIIAKFEGAADDKGIYAVIITLNDCIADKGVVEMVYYGAKNTPQENSVVNTYRIEYSKNNDGTYEIDTYSDGKTDQKLHGKKKVTVNNTFSATVRAESVTVSYAPEGETPKEIYTANADQLRSR